MSSADETWSDEQVHAYVDGELAPGDASRLTRRILQDGELAARVARQRALRAQLAQAFDPVLREPVPQRLLDAIEGSSSSATPIGLARSARARPMPPPIWWGAAAASLLLALLVGWLLPRTNSPFTQSGGALLAAGALEDALSEQLSTADEPGNGTQIVLSMRAQDGRYCRVFRLESGTDGLACRSGLGWQIEATGHASASASAPDQYRQASSPLSPAVLGALSNQQAGEALTAEEERRAHDNGWR